MYPGLCTAVKLKNGVSKKFDGKNLVGVNQGSVLSLLPFIIVMEALSSSFNQGLHWERLYTNDLLLVAESEEKL